MPSVTDVQQQSSTTHGKSTPPPPQQQQQTNSLTTDGNSFDGLTQSILALEKKQRNLGKRKEKLEGYKQEAEKGTELNKDQREALAKYPEVIGQIECVKDILEQIKKIQTESIKNQKRLSKQMAEEKRLQISQRMNEYAHLTYLLDHRPQTLKTEDSFLLDELSRLILPTDNSATTMSRSVDTVLSIYHGGPLVPTIKQLTGKNPQELREILEQLIKDSQNPSSQQEQQEEEQQQKPTEEHIEEQQQETEVVQSKGIDEINTDVSSSHVNEEDLTHRNYSDYPLQFDTRNQNIILEQMIENSPFFSDDLKKNSISQENFLQSNADQQQQYLSTHSNDQTSTLISPNEQKSDNDQQQSNEDQWQQSRSNANHQRNNQSNRGHYHPRSSYPHQYQQQQQQQQWRGSTRGGRYNGSHSTPGQQQTRPYNDNGYRGRPGTNPNYRGNRGGNYRGGYRGGNSNANYHGNGNGNGYVNENLSRANSSQQNVDQHRPVVSSVNSLSS